VKRFLSRGGHDLTDDEAEAVLDAPAGAQIRSMTRYTAAGTPDVVVKYLEDFARRADADELIVTFPVVGRAAWFRSFELLAQQVTPAAV
jgi:alkanesulfonate monooxygenase SsuD/methylene tetrahydromethanopterin reductase-like flavin-dependent oxidoreductase (luciferase family)